MLSRFDYFLFSEVHKGRKINFIQWNFGNPDHDDNIYSIIAIEFVFFFQLFLEFVFPLSICCSLFCVP